VITNDPREHLSSEAFRLNDIKFLPLDSTLNYLYLYFDPYFYFESSVRSQS